MNELTDKPFVNVNELAERYNRTRQTIYKWMKLDVNPFPKPKINQTGISSLWSTSDVLSWENQSITD